MGPIMPRPILRTIVFTTLLAAPGLAPDAAAQDVAASVGIGAGGTYYCIVSRCGTGRTLGFNASINATHMLAIEAAVRKHYCFDCGRFVIGESMLLLQYPKHTVQPFVGAGISFSSDPELMGDELGLAGAVGASAQPWQHWGVRLELRGRQVGKGDAMGELSVFVSRHFVRTRS
jgi:hypothetical protein